MISNESPQTGRLAEGRMELIRREERMEVCRRRRGCCGMRGPSGVFVRECASVEVRNRQGGVSAQEAGSVCTPEVIVGAVSSASELHFKPLCFH